MRRKTFLFFILAAVIAAAAAWTLVPGGRKIAIAPPADRPAAPLPEPPVSILSVPLSVSMEELRTLARTRLPEEISGSSPVRESLFDGRGSYLVRKEGEPDVTVEGDRLVLSVPVAFRARLNGTGTALGLSVPVSLSAEGAATIMLSMKPSVTSDWQVRTQPRIVLKWLRPPSSRILGIRVTFQNAAEEFLRSRIEEALPRIDQALNESLGLKERAGEAWEKIQAPVRVSESPELWLSARPMSLSIPPLGLEKDMVLLDARLEALLNLGTKEPEKKAPTPLPSLSTSAAAPGGRGFTLQLPVFLGWEPINRKLGKDLSGRTLDMGGGRSLTIDKVSVSANGDRLAFAVGIRAVEGAGLFSTRRAGTVYILGTPKWDRSRQVLSLDALDFDEGTTRGLLRTAAWIGRPILLEKLGEAAVFPMSGPAGEATNALGRLLERRQVSDGLTFGGSARQTALESVAVTEDGLALLVRAEGTAALEWNPDIR